MPPIIPSSDDDDDDDEEEEEEIQPVDEEEQAPAAPHGTRAAINLPGSLPDAKRLRLHDPPAAGAVWNFQPKVVMADGATAVDAAVVKVFANKEKLDEFAPSGEKNFWHNIEGADDMVNYYVGADIPPGAFAQYMSGVVCFDCEWNTIPSMERQRPKGGGNGKVAIITLGTPCLDEDDSPYPLEACLVHLAAYMTFPDELRAVFTSKDVRVVGEIARPECARAPRVRRERASQDCEQSLPCSRCIDAPDLRADPLLLRSRCWDTTWLETSHG